MTASILVLVLAALLGGGGIGGYLGVRRTANATETVAATSRPHEQLTAETEAFRVFMAEARALHEQLSARLVECEHKHAEAESERARLEQLVDELQARIAHLERIARTPHPKEPNP